MDVVANSDLVFADSFEIEHDIQQLVQDLPFAGVIGYDGKKICFVNQECLKIFGKTAGELIGQDLLSAGLIADSSIEDVKSRIGTATEGVYELRCKRSDGSIFPAEVYAKELGGSRYRLRLAAIRDLSPLHQARGQKEATEEKYKRLLFNLVHVLSHTLEKRDPYTSGHQNRVAQLSKAISTQMGMSDSEIEGIVLSAQLHDLGKISIPAETLTKIGKLSSLEFSVLQIHTMQGYEILQGVDLPWPVAQVCRSHHERLDGSGYPDGLSGDSIGIESRIVGVADVLEAMCNPRPYRKALGLNVALAEVRKGRGIHFDKEVVDAATSVLLEHGFNLQL